MQNVETATAPDVARLERRKAPRLTVLGQVEGQLGKPDTPATLRDISTTGMAVETIGMLRVGQTYQFRLNEHEQLVTISAKVVHTMRVNVPNRLSYFVSGLQFTQPEKPEERNAINALIGRAVVANGRLGRR